MGGARGQGGERGLPHIEVLRVAQPPLLIVNDLLTFTIPNSFPPSTHTSIPSKKRAPHVTSGVFAAAARGRRQGSTTDMPAVERRDRE